ncbi:MAG: LysR family transcriptional regulator [Pseudomonadota bacterium]
MELRQLKTFQTVGHLLSFYRAAEKLHYAQSTVSAQIKALEEEFGVPLFDRLGKKVVLTEGGEMLMQYAEKMLAIEEETKAGVSGHKEPQGTISLRIPESIGTYLMGDAFRQFHQTYPKISFNISNCAFHTLKQEFKTGITDLAFLIAGYVSAPELVVEALGFITIVAVCSPDHPAVAKRTFTLQDFSGETLLLPKHDCSYKMEIEKELVESSIEIAAKLEITSVEMIKQWVMKGVGIAILPEIAIRNQIKSGHLRVLPWENSGREQAVLMLWHKDKWLFPALQAFMDATRCSVRLLTEGQGHHVETLSQN